MLFDYSKLEGKIKEVFDIQENFAAAMGLSVVSISNKLNNKSQWTQTEIQKAVELLGIDPLEISAYFFAEKVKEAKQIKVRNHIHNKRK